MFSFRKIPAFLVLILSTGILSCNIRKKQNTDIYCSHVFADSLRTWILKKMPDSSRQWIEEKDSIKIFFYEDVVRKLWQPVYSDSIVNELSQRCGFRWEELPSWDENKRWQLSLPFIKKDTTFITPNNLLIYLFKQQ